MQTESEPLSAQSFITLPNGRIVRVAAVELLLDILNRGVRIETDGQDILVRRDGTPIDEEDRERLRQFKPHILALLAFAGEERIQ